MKTFTSWVVHSLQIAALVVAVPLIAAVAVYAFVGWLVLLLLASSDLPGHYSLIAFVAWVLCAGAVVTFTKEDT